MKTIIPTIIAIILLSACGHRPPKAAITYLPADTAHFHYFTDSIPRFVSQSQLDAVLEQLADGDNFLFPDLYPIIDTLPIISADPFTLAERLEKEGFEQTKGGHGNWEKGPRFRYRMYEKDGLQCRIFKAYAFNEKGADGDYNLRAYEQIECRKK